MARQEMEHVGPGRRQELMDEAGEAQGQSSDPRFGGGFLY